MENLIGENASTGNAVSDSTDAAFVQDVVEVSKSTPVIVDFWSPSCGPCKQLTPILEKIANGSNGAVRLVKVNIDDHPQIAGQLRVQSVPAVFGFHNGQPVDAFMGAQPESQVMAFAQKLVATAGGQLGPSPIEQALAQATEFYDNGQYKEAGNVYGQAVTHDPGNAAAAAGLIKCYLKLDAIEPAGEVIDQLDKDVKAMPEMVSAIALYELAIAGNVSNEDLQKLLDRIAADENDHQARLDYAISAFSSGQQLEAMDAVFYIINKDMEWNEQAARKQLLEFFKALGPTNPITLKGRRRLSSLLFS